MRQILALFPVLAFLLQPVVGPLPTKEELCSTVVDIEVRKLCLDCFTDAGSLQESPDEFRFCVGSYLPQSLADCSVPHHEKKGHATRPAQRAPQPHQRQPHAAMPHQEPGASSAIPGEGEHHRQERRADREGRRHLEPGEGRRPGAHGRRRAEQAPEQRDVKSMVDSVASECLTKYHNHGHGSGGGTRSRRMSVRTLEKALTLDLEEAAEEDAAEDFSSIIHEDDGWRGRRFAGNRGNGKMGKATEMEATATEATKATEATQRATQRSKRGNNPSLRRQGPIGGIYPERIENHFGYELISLMSREEFFLPIPSWWLEPLAVYYKEFREKFENGTSV
nr:uncharacterized protein LOC113814111 [Penaeus vannamei]